MYSVSESLNPPADRKSVATGGNCAAAMQGGEQPEEQVRSQSGLPRLVNSIRPVHWASSRANSEACRIGGEPWTAHNLSTLDHGRCKGGWSENARKSAWMKIRDRREGLNSAGVRALIVATKPGNCGGAKERRKVNAQ